MGAVRKQHMSILLWFGFFTLSFVVFYLFSDGDFSFLMVREMRYQSEKERERERERERQREADKEGGGGVLWSEGSRHTISSVLQHVARHRWLSGADFACRWFSVRCAAALCCSIQSSVSMVPAGNCTEPSRTLLKGFPRSRRCRFALPRIHIHVRY